MTLVELVDIDYPKIPALINPEGVTAIVAGSKIHDRETTLVFFGIGGTGSITRPYLHTWGLPSEVAEILGIVIKR